MNNPLKKKLIVFTTILIFFSNFSLFSQNAIVFETNLNSTDLVRNINQFEIEIQKLPLESELNIDAGSNSGIKWNNNLRILDNPYQPINPTTIVDNNNNIHIIYSTYENGRSLFHTIIYENKTMSVKNCLFNEASGSEVNCDATADSEGKIHIVYSWGPTESQIGVYYLTWENNQWSSHERADFGETVLGSALPAHHPKIAVDKFGNAHILWSGQTNWNRFEFEEMKIYYQRRIGPNEWTPIIFVSYGIYNGFIIEVTKDNKVHAAISIKFDDFFLQYHMITYFSKGLTSGSFGLGTELLYENLGQGTLTYPGTAFIEMNDTLYFFGVSLVEDSERIFYMKKNNDVFGNKITLTQNVATNGRIKIDGITSVRGDIVLVWTYNTYISGIWEGGINHCVRKSATETWSSDSYITSNYTTSFEPSISYDSKDNIHVIWWDDHPSSGKALYYQSGSFDSDLDGLTNIDEVEVYNTNPFKADTDSDLLIDGEEIILGLDPLDPDEDSDSQLDGWEISYGLDPNNATDANDDNDVDGLINLNEFGNQTNPFNNDTDTDLLLDGEEITIYKTSPIMIDTDSDDLDDYIEIFSYLTNATNPDTEGDGLPDGYEIAYSLDPLLNDSHTDPDNDSILNIDEFYFLTNPQNNDTDFDLLSDYFELFNCSTNPLEPDSDFDQLDDYYELTINPLDATYSTNNTYLTNPNLADSDFDSLTDFQEIDIYLTNPLVNDTDGDSMPDGYEIFYDLNPFVDDSQEDYDQDGLTNLIESTLYSNPNSTDTDSDSLTDFEEYELGTDPTKIDTDGDILSDFYEITFSNTDPTNADGDNDNLDDFEELFDYNTSPFNNDTDQDTLLDGDEVLIYYSNPNKYDTDDDSLIDPLEIMFNSNPNKRDTDGDGMEDFFEYQYNFNPQKDDSHHDNDTDGLFNLEEFWFETNPRKNDTDRDGLTDYAEAYVYLTSPIVNDTDDDSLLDYDEIFIFNTKPNDFDSDDDSLNDGEEILIYNTDPNNSDSDYDGFSDYTEVIQNTNPLNPKNNPRSQLIKKVSLSFGGIIVGLIIYYSLPALFMSLRKNNEDLWIKQGIDFRVKKNKKLTAQKDET